MRCHGGALRTLLLAVVDRNRWRSHPHRRPGPRAGAQLRSWQQFQQLSLLSTGCGGGASQGWAPARGPGRRVGHGAGFDGSLPGFARRFRWRGSGPPPSLPRKRGRRLRAACGRFHRRSGARVGCSHRCLLLRGQGRDGRSLFCARFACAGVRARGRAYRGGAVRARDCPRETAGAPRPSVPARVFFAAPASRFLQKRRKAAPGEPPLSTFILHHVAKCQARVRTKNENTGDFSWNAGGTGARRSSSRHALSPSRLSSSCPDCRPTAYTHLIWPCIRRACRTGYVPFYGPFRHPGPRAGVHP